MDVYVSCGASIGELIGMKDELWAILVQFDLLIRFGKVGDGV